MFLTINFKSYISVEQDDLRQPKGNKTALIKRLFYFQIFRLRMAAGWSKTNVSQNIEYSHKWEIQNFDLAMAVGGGKLESCRFCIPGVPEEFYMELKNKTECTSYGYEMKLGDQELDAKFNFSVVLKSTVMGTKAAGKLEVIKEGANTLHYALCHGNRHFHKSKNSLHAHFTLKSIHSFFR